ncbi:MAG: right-handed parallel beta-helix repeat-containing protein [Clostridia bacterium]|nr:right-handed parallel beta-helix repeat-containing protein [Clostridia bacterium]
MFDIVKYGAVGDGVTMNTTAIQAAIDDAAKVHGTVLIPEGVFLSGTLVNKGASLHLSSGAVLKASGDIADYPVQPYHHNEMGDLTAFLVCLYQENITIDGSGTIDLSGHCFYDMDAWSVPEGTVTFTEEQMHECTHPIGKRPGQCIFFHGCRNVTLRGVRIIDAPCWTTTFSECENVKCLGLTIDTDLTIPNDDGIHVTACKGVIISDCNISSGDDCIALSAITNWEKPCEDIVITNCILRSCSKAIVIGYMYSVVRNVLISNCIIRESNRGLTFMAHDECALIENVRVTNCLFDTRVRAGNWWGNGEPILMMAVPHDFYVPAEQRPARTTDCAMRNIRISNVTCTGENAMGIVGVNGNIREVTLREIDYTRKPSANIALKGERLDLAPCDAVHAIPADCALYIAGGAEVETAGLMLRGMRIITKN